MGLENSWSLRLLSLFFPDSILYGRTVPGPVDLSSACIGILRTRASDLELRAGSQVTSCYIFQQIPTLLETDLSDW